MRIPFSALSAADAAKVRALPPGERPAKAEDEWSATEVALAWAKVSGRRVVPLSEARVDEAAYAVFWRHCQAHSWLPLFVGADVACVVSPYAHLPPVRREVAKRLRTEIYWAVCTEDDFDRTIALLAQPAAKSDLPPPVEVPQAWSLKEDRSAPDPVRAWVVEVVDCAHRLGASDIHFEADSRRVEIRMRLSGVLEPFPPIPGTKRGAFLAALKRVAGVDPNARNETHDRGFRLSLPGGRDVTVRASFAPSLNGEAIVFRVQDSKRMISSGLRVPLPPDQLARFSEILARKSGLVLVSGPTGSGKTTTLYAALLGHLDITELCIRTAEDPVEYEIPGITQTAVGGASSLTYAKMIETFMRQNPDVILVGEVRQPDTASAGLQASLTGHMTLTTIHATDATDTITRYVDIVNAPDARTTLATVLSMVVAQRLAPRLCASCREPRPVTTREAALYAQFGLPAPAELYRRHGCPDCGTGFRGRAPVVEFLEMTPELRDIVRQAPWDTAAFRRAWWAQGGVPLGMRALMLAAEGVIAFEAANELMVWAPPTADIGHRLPHT